MIFRSLSHINLRQCELGARFNRMNLGQPIGLADPMIAALALTHGLELVTANTAHFQQVRNLGYPLILVNWRTP